ncbi:monovalent cation/H(+) antiporter subunit G [Coralliovum pocilloporae]|uniref:monovalent cation/H(+) antiporter subunit G n=1 Tax=Coralliovum pocilloporae TaxID=3066369 RepID=UPI003307BD3A
MIFSVLEALSAVLVLIGALFALVASIGILRFPDLYTRMHAASKAGTLGSGLMLLALAIHSLEPDVVTRALAGIIFFLLTAPISSHLLARAAYVVGYKPWDGTVRDDYKDYLDKGGQ